MLRANSNGGFSYIELLVVTALVLVFYAMVLGPGSRLGQEKRKAECALRLQQAYLSLSLYARDHHESFPASTGALTSEKPLSLLVPEYTANPSVFICPASGLSDLPAAQPFAERRISYAYYMGTRSSDSPDAPLLTDAQANTNSLKVAKDPLFSEKAGTPAANHRQYGGNILYSDGRVEAVSLRAPHDLPAAPGAILLNPKP